MIPIVISGRKITDKAISQLKFPHPIAMYAEPRLMKRYPPVFGRYEAMIVVMITIIAGYKCAIARASVPPETTKVSIAKSERKIANAMARATGAIRKMCL